jgi:beta-glucosidase
MIRVNEEIIEELLSQLTLEEKVRMIHGEGLFQSGGVERLSIPPMIMSDGPMGVRKEFEQASWINIGSTYDMVSYLPSNSALASTWNKELAYETGKVLGAEARGRGKDVILAPGINIKRSPLCGRNFEYMSEDPKLIEELVVPFIRGIQENDVAACVKHFAANNQETARLSVDTEVDERALREIYFPGFKAAVKEGETLTLMGAYNKLRGEHCCESKFLLGKVLREEWNFDGAIISDWGGVHNTKNAAESELDIEMSVTPEFDEYYMANPLLRAVKNGEIEEAVIDKKIRNILRTMLRLKMLGEVKENRKSGSYNTPQHRETILNTAREAVILLKNENKRLPIRRHGLKRLAVIGRNAEMLHSDGGGSAEIKALYEISPLMGLKKALGGNVQLSYAKGYYVPEKDEKNEINWQQDSLNQDIIRSRAGEA